MRFRKTLSLLSLALLAGAAAPLASHAAITTIGPATLSTGYRNDELGGTYIQYSGTTPSPQYVSPVEGTIVRWRIDSGWAGRPVRLRVLRPAGSGKFVGVGTSALGFTSAAGPDTFPTSLPIKAGDMIGVDNSGVALIFTNVPGDYLRQFFPAIVDGSPARTPQTYPEDEGLQVQVNADIQPTSSGGTGGVGGADGVGGPGGSGGLPTLARLKVAPNGFSAAAGGGSIAKSRKPKAGATVSYTDSQVATTTFTLLQSQPGARSKQGVCVKPPRKPRTKRCTRLVTIGSFKRTDTAGANGFHFTGRANGRKLKPGGYQLQAVARNASGQASKPVLASFRVTK